MKKKVIFVTNALWVGGIETALINLLNYIDYDKFDVTLLTLQAIFDFDMKAKIPASCRLLTIDRERKHSYHNKYKFNRLYHLTEKSENPSLIHKLMMWTMPLIKWIENRLYIRFVRELMRLESFDTAVIYSDVAAEATIRAIHADRYLMFYHHGAMRHAYHDRIAYKKCEKIIAVSENQARELRQFVPAAARRRRFSAKAAPIVQVYLPSPPASEASAPIHCDSSPLLKRNSELAATSTSAAL